MKQEVSPLADSESSVLLEQAHKVAALLAQNEEVKFFHQAEQKILRHEKIQSLIKTLKKKQKEIVAFEHTFPNPVMVQKIEQEMADLEDELSHFPLVKQYQQSQVEINLLLQAVIAVIFDKVSEVVPIEKFK